MPDVVSRCVVRPRLHATQRHAPAAGAGGAHEGEAHVVPHAGSKWSRPGVSFEIAGHFHERGGHDSDSAEHVQMPAQWRRGFRGMMTHSMGGVKTCPHEARCSAMFSVYCMVSYSIVMYVHRCVHTSGAAKTSTLLLGTGVEEHPKAFGG